MRFEQVVMAQSIPSVSIPLSGICHLVSLGGGEFVGKPLPGVGHLSILLEAANSVLFLIFHPKYAYIDSYRYFFEDHF